MTSWTRPYKDPIRLLTGAFVLFIPSFFAYGAIRMAIHWKRDTLVGLLLLAAAVTVPLAFAWRLHRTALMVNRSGVRVRWLLRTRTVTWEQVHGFDTSPDWPVPERLWIQLTDGSKLRTPVRRRHSTPYRVSDGGTVLGPEDYQELLADLQKWRAGILR